MRALIIALALLAPTPVSAQSTWTTLSADGLSLRAPPGTTLEADHGIDSATWQVHNPRFTVKILYGPFIGDYDDSEPTLCYTHAPIAIDGRTAVLRSGKGFPRLDCPERYASLYLPASRVDGPALFISGFGESQDDVQTIRSVIATLRLPPRP